MTRSAPACLATARDVSLFAVNISPRGVRQNMSRVESVELRYTNHVDAAIKNLEKKIAKGKYDATLALKLWLYVAESACAAYAANFFDNAQDWKAQINVATRKAIAAELANEYQERLFPL